MSMRTSGDHAMAGGQELAPGLTGLRELGGGVTYEAWLAFDERLYAPVVVKIVRPELVDDPATRSTFERELSVMTSLAHPGIARLFAYDDEAERPYFVIEHIDGPTLSSLISKHGHLPEHQLLSVAVDLCSAAHYLHGLELCHLDIKPSNIVAGAPAKLIDFSVAQSFADAAQQMDPIGSDEYMAPEQCAPGDAAETNRVFSGRGVMGPASDVWAIGATLFRAAAGYRAFDREPKWQQLTEAPRALPHFLDARISDVIMDCLAPNPDDRPTPAQVLDRLDPIVATLPKARLSGFSVRL